MAGVAGGMLYGLRFGNGSKIVPKRAKSDLKVRKTVKRHDGRLQVRANVTRGFLEKLEARQRKRDAEGIVVLSVRAGTLPASVLDEYTEEHVRCLLARASANAAAMEWEQERELFS